jgi:hypothetical protein
MHENLEMKGRLTLRITDRSGAVVREQISANRIVTTGRQLVAQLFGGVTAGTPPSQVTHMAVGTNPAPRPTGKRLSGPSAGRASQSPTSPTPSSTSRRQAVGRCGA